jgi:hypothetical protein
MGNFNAYLKFSKMVPGLCAASPTTQSGKRDHGDHVTLPPSTFLPIVPDQNLA